MRFAAAVGDVWVLWSSDRSAEFHGARVGVWLMAMYWATPPQGNKFDKRAHAHQQEDQYTGGYGGGGGGGASAEFSGVKMHVGVRVSATN